MRPEVQIRSAQMADLVQILPLITDIVVSLEPVTYAAEVLSDQPEEAYIKAFQQILLPPHESLVAVLDSAIVGYLQISFIPGLTRHGGTRAIIEDIRVKRSHRGQNIGRKLIEDAITRAKSRKCWVLQLTTNKWREDAIGFYEKIGFHRTHEGLRIQF